RMCELAIGAPPESYSGRATRPCPRAGLSLLHGSKIVFLGGYSRTNHASRAIMALHPCGCISEREGSRQGSLHIPVCANRLRFWAAAVVNEGVMEQIFRHDRKRGHTNWRSPFRLITASAVIHASGDGKWTVWHGSCDGCKPRAQCLGPNAG